MPTSDSSSPGTLRRRRGGQPGNANNLKHGLYARPTLPPVPACPGSFGERSLQGIIPRNPSSVPVTDLQAEIDLYREYIRRYAEASLLSEPGDPESSRRSLLALAYASNQLAALVRIQAHAQRFTATSREFERWLSTLPSPDETDE